MSVLSSASRRGPVDMPFGAWSNGLPALAWVPLLDLDRCHGYAVLEALRGAGVAACLAASGPAARAVAGGEPDRVRLWVDVPRRAVAEDVLLGLLPRLRRPTDGASRRGPEGRTAGRGPR